MPKATNCWFRLLASPAFKKRKRMKKQNRETAFNVQVHFMRTKEMLLRLSINPLGAPLISIL
jgi:hypothetical protein